MLYDPAVVADARTHPHVRARHRFGVRANLPRPLAVRGIRLDAFGVEADPCRAFAQSCISGSNYGVGLVLVGTPGTGKTTLAVATMIEVLENATFDWLGRSGHYPYRPGYFTQHTDFIRLHHDSWKADERAEAAQDVLDSLYHRHLGSSAYRNTKVLILDDVGKENPTVGTGHKSQVMHDVLRLRYNAGAPTIITTNIPLPGWVDAYGEATASFLHEGFAPVIMAGRDRRRA